MNLRREVESYDISLKNMPTLHAVMFCNASFVMHLFMQ